MLRVEEGHSEASHRHEHRIDLALPDGAAREIVDDTAEQRRVDGMVVQVDEARQGDPAGNGDRLGSLGRITGYIGNPAALHDNRIAL